MGKRSDDRGIRLEPLYPNSSDEYQQMLHAGYIADLFEAASPSEAAWEVVRLIDEGEWNPFLKQLVLKRLSPSKPKPGGRKLDPKEKAILYYLLDEKREELSAKGMKGVKLISALTEHFDSEESTIKRWLRDMKRIAKETAVLAAEVDAILDDIEPYLVSERPE